MKTNFKKVIEFNTCFNHKVSNEPYIKIFDNEPKLVIQRLALIEEEINELRNVFNLKDEIIITTFGDAGASVDDLKVSAKNITPISTNGAGDALIGVFMALKGEFDNKVALQRAVDYATEVCKITGPRIKNAT